MQVHPLSSRAGPSGDFRITRPSNVNRPAETVLGGSRKKVVLFGVAGALCALGIAVAIGMPTGPPATPLPEQSPTMAVTVSTPQDTSLESPSTDPRAFVVAEALAGHLGEAFTRMSDLTASVTSRNGDVVLVAVQGMSETGERRVDALVVRTSEGWVIRETYDAGV